jgi:prepilin-type N-terminal cleavage/methylation domain-containing protein
LAQVIQAKSNKLTSANQSGYTLVEVLIAMVILVSLMFTANYSYSMYSQYFSGRLGQFDRSMFRYQGMLQIKETIESAIPYIVKNSRGEHTFYFLGRAQGLTFVSAAPIFAVTNNDVSVVRIFSEQTAQGYQLVYEEAPLTDTLLVDLDQPLDFKYRTVLMKSTELLSFSYFGWDVREHKYDRQTHTTTVPRWGDSYDASVTRVQPEILKMHIGSQVLAYELAKGHDKLINFYIEDRIN